MGMRHRFILERELYPRGLLTFLSSPTLASLRYFDVAARLLSFKAAARELHVTQGAVSQQIKHLEQALGCKLFHRLPRHIVLTEEGRVFAASVSQALAEIERCAKSIRAVRSPTEIRLRAGPSFALRWLVPRVGAFYAAHPDIRLFISAAYGYFDPAHRTFDLAIEMLKDELPTLHTEVLMTETLTPVCSPAYLAQNSFLKSPDDLARCTLLHDAHAWSGASEDAEWRYWLSQVGATNVDSTRGQFFTLSNMSIEAALSHQGVAMGRNALVADCLATKQLVQPFAQALKSPYRYCLVYPKEHTGHWAISAVVAWLHAQAKGRFEGHDRNRSDAATVS
jgi:LysR family transcriptional regulator, glycine cleavage system transcriptional activator